MLLQKIGMTGFTSLYDLYFVLLLNSHPSLASGARSCGILRLAIFCLHLVVVLPVGWGCILKANTPDQLQEGHSFKNDLC